MLLAGRRPRTLIVGRWRGVGRPARRKEELADNLTQVGRDATPPRGGTRAGVAGRSRARVGDRIRLGVGSTVRDDRGRVRDRSPVGQSFGLQGIGLALGLARQPERCVAAPAADSTPRGADPDDDRAVGARTGRLPGTLSSSAPLGALAVARGTDLVAVLEGVRRRVAGEEPLEIGQLRPVDEPRAREFSQTLARGAQESLR